MKKNESGFSAVEGLLVLVVVVVVSFSGWYIWQSRQKHNTTPSTPTATNSTSSNTEATTPSPAAKVDTTVTDVNLSLKKESDIDKLPSSTPASFKAYMLDNLKKNKPDADGCIHLYSISKISSVNVRGGGSSVSESATDDMNCMGGAPRVWVLAPGEKWEDVSLNSPACKSPSGGLIYQEFVAECYPDVKIDSLVKNPNGSITSLAQ